MIRIHIYYTASGNQTLFKKYYTACKDKKCDNIGDYYTAEPVTDEVECSGGNYYSLEVSYYTS